MFIIAYLLLIYSVGVPTARLPVRTANTVQVTTTSISGEVILYYLSNIIYTNSIVLIAMYNYIDDCC